MGPARTDGRRTGRARSDRRAAGRAAPRLETEAKFLLDDPSEADAFLAALGVAGPPRVEALRDTYYDTRDGALLSAGWAYRVRSRAGARPEATLKAIGRSGPDGVHRREEVTARLASPDPHPTLLPDGRLRTTLLAWAGDEPLQPLARVSSSRSTWSAVRGGLRVEASLDRTTASSGRARRRWVEVEVELAAGTDRAFARLVAGLVRATGRRPVVEGKLARILAAAGRPVPGDDEIALARLAGGARPVAAGDPAAAALCRVLAAGARRLARATAGVRAGSDPEAVHAVRTSARRLRAVLRVFREADRGERDRARAALRALGRAAGAVRDEQIALDALETERRLSRGNAALARAIDARARSAWGRLRRWLDSPEGRSLPRRVAEVGARAAGRASPPFAVAGAARVPREAERALRDAARVAAAPRAAPATLHALRLSAKRARYAAEAFSDAFGAPVARFVASARRLQDDLGTIQDEVSLRAALRRALARVPSRAPERAAAARAADAALAAAGRAAGRARARLGARVEAAFGERAMRRLGAHLLGRAARAASAPTRLP